MKVEMTKEEIAHHEAGHATIAYLLELPVPSVSIKKGDGLLGITISEKDMTVSQDPQRLDKLTHLCSDKLTRHVCCYSLLSK